MPLNAAADLIARECKVSETEAREALDSAIRDGKVHGREKEPLSTSHNPIIWRRAAQRRVTIDPDSWDASRINWATNEGFRCTEIEVMVADIQSFLAASGCIEAVEGASPPAEAYLPEYVALILRAISEYGISDSNQPKAEELRNWFERQSVNGEQISANLARAMTTIVRRPDRKKGGAIARRRKG
jgi:hypothetical protein